MNKYTLQEQIAPGVEGYMLKILSPEFKDTRTEVYRDRSAAWRRYSELQRVWCLMGASFMKVKMWYFQMGKPDRVVSEATLCDGKWYFSFGQYLREKYGY